MAVNAGAVGPETIDDVLSHTLNLADQIGTANYRIANAISGSEPTKNSQAPTPVESSLMARLKEVRRILQAAEVDTYRTKNALGLQ